MNLSYKNIVKLSLKTLFLFYNFYYFYYFFIFSWTFFIPFLHAFKVRRIYYLTYIVVELKPFLLRSCRQFVGAGLQVQCNDTGGPLLSRPSAPQAFGHAVQT